MKTSHLRAPHPYLTAFLIALALLFSPSGLCAGDMPEPLQRYLNFAIQDPRPVREVRMQLVGQVILPGADAAIPVEGVQVVAADRPMFDWQVSARVNWAITARIRDLYEDGQGSIHSRLNRLRTIIDDHDIDELNRTQLARWSGLAVMAPTAFLNPDVFVWQQDGPDAVIATVSDGDLTITHRFQFDAEGRLVESRSEDRWERYDGTYLRTGSIMRRGGWAEIDGITVPLTFAITRIEPDGSETEFWVGRFSDIKVIR